MVFVLLWGSEDFFRLLNYRPDPRSWGGKGLERGRDRCGQGIRGRKSICFRNPPDFMHAPGLGPLANVPRAQ